jgi:glycosyltransferase involved in cell wall biosynthesis
VATVTWCRRLSPARTVSMMVVCVGAATSDGNSRPPARMMNVAARRTLAFVAVVEVLDPAVVVMGAVVVLTLVVLGTVPVLLAAVLLVLSELGALVVTGLVVLVVVDLPAVVVAGLPDPPHPESASAASTTSIPARLMTASIRRTALSNGVPIALLTTFLAGYRLPLYRRLAERHGIEVLCYGRGERYVPAWFSDLDRQLAEADFPARRLNGLAEALSIGRRYDAVIAPFAGGAVLPAAYAGARRSGRPFVLWASVWVQPRSAVHGLALPVTRHIYRHADAVVAYGEHVRRFVAGIRGHVDDVFVAPQAVEPELFARPVGPEEVSAFRAAHQLGGGPLVLYTGRLVAEKGIEVLAAAWPQVQAQATLVVVGDGPLSLLVAGLDRTRLLGPLPRRQLPVAYSAAAMALLPSVPTSRFTEPWGLVCNEAMHQGRPVVASAAVGAVAGGLVVHEANGLVVGPGDPAALARAIERLLRDDPLRRRLGSAARTAVAGYTYEAMADAFARALDVAMGRRSPRTRARAIKPSPTGPEKTR